MHSEAAHHATAFPGLRVCIQPPGEGVPACLHEQPYGGLRELVIGCRPSGMMVIVRKMEFLLEF